MDLYPPEAARVVTTAFQGDVKKALVELAPLQWDAGRNRLVLTHRLVVRLSFQGRDTEEQPTTGSRGRRYRRRNSESSRRVVARWATQEPGLYGVGFEEAFGRRRGRTLRAEALRLSRQGQAVPFHLQGPDPSAFGPGSTLYFVSAGANANPYGDTAVYELEAGVSGELMPIRSAAPSGETTPFYWETLEQEQNRMYQSTLVEAPDRWLWSMLFAPTTKSYSFEVSSLAPTSQTSSLSVRLQGASDFGATPDHHVRLSVNGTFVGEARWNGKSPQRIDAEVGAGLLREGTNVLEIENVGDTEADYSMVILDRFSLSYPRLLQARNGTLEGDWSTSGTAEVDGLSPESFVLEDQGGTFIWLDGVETTEMGVRFRAEAGRSYMTVSPEAVHRAVALPLPQRSRLRETSLEADYLLIGPRDFIDAASALVAHRRSQGLEVRTAPVEEIFSTFGFGETNPKAIRDFIAYAYHKWDKAPRYVVLLGDATYDFKDYLGTGVVNRTPPLLVMTTFLETVSDPAYAAVNGDDLLPDLAIGRLPAGR
jgi:hypothetical protein